MRVELGHLLGRFIPPEVRKSFPIVAQSPQQFGHLINERGGTFAIIGAVHEIGGKLLSNKGEYWARCRSKTAEGQVILFRQKLDEREESGILLEAYGIGKTVKEELKAPTSRVVISVLGKYWIDVTGDESPPQF